MNIYIYRLKTKNSVNTKKIKMKKLLKQNHLLTATLSRYFTKPLR